MQCGQLYTHAFTLCTVLLTGDAHALVRHRYKFMCVHMQTVHDCVYNVELQARTVHDLHAAPKASK